MKFKLGLISLIFVLFFLSNLKAAFEPKGVGIPYLASAGCGRAVAEQPFLVFLNPAALTQIKQRSVQIFYKNYYEIENLNLMALEARFKPLGIPLGFGVVRYGLAEYQEADVRMATAFGLFDVLHLGFSVNVYSVYLKDNENSVSAGFTLAASWSIIKTLRWAVVVENLNEPELGAAKEKIPLQMVFSQSWQVSGKVALLVDLVKEQDYDFDTRLGMSYRLSPAFTLYAGFRNLVPVFSGGFSTNVGSFQLGYAYEYHVDLGGSHSIGAGYAF